MKSDYSNKDVWWAVFIWSVAIIVVVTAQSIITNEKVISAIEREVSSCSINYQEGQKGE